jgi:hypothetical protein
MSVETADKLWRKIALSENPAEELLLAFDKVVRAEREAILQLIAAKRVDTNMYDGAYVLRAVMAAIRERE